jgi:peptide/nickel transport system substrate-binding protein
MFKVQGLFENAISGTVDLVEAPIQDREKANMENDKRLIKKILKDKRTTRREFMGGALAMGMSVPAASLMWSQAHAATPKRGGHLNAGLNGFNIVDSLDPTTFLSTTMVMISRAFRDSLLDVGQDNTAQPGLAESWEPSADAKTWRFKLRKGVTFSDGKSLTTEDVINSINVHRGDDSTSGAKGLFSGITDVTADGSDVVVVSLADANADFPFLMTDYHMNIVPTRDGKADVLSKEGTGLYNLIDFEPGVGAKLERNPNAWQSEFGFFDSVEIITILDDAARESALITQAVDVINRPVQKTISLLKNLPHIDIVNVKSNYAFTHPMRMDQAPFDNAEFRQALKLALPRQEFIDKILYGYGEIGNDQPLGPLFNNYDPSITSEYDPDKAKSLIKKAGLEGLEFDIHTADTAYPGAVDAAQIFAASFAEIGVSLNVVREANDGYWSNVWNKKPFSSCNWGARPVEDMILSIAYVSDAAWNDTGISIERVDELVKAARGELDTVKRKAMYSEVQRLISTQGGTLIPAFGDDLAAVNKKIGIGPNIGGGWEMDGGHFIKRWWMKG